MRLIQGDEQRRFVVDGDGEAAAVQKELADNVAPGSLVLRKCGKVK